MASVLKFLLCLALVCLPPPGGSRAGDGIDYAQPEAWLALPGLASPAGLTPRGGGFSDLQEQARADLFYVHPTTGMRGDVANVPIDDPDALRTSRVMLAAQATAFNAVARIYAPRYRQMSLPLYERGEDGLQAPMNRAYADVRRAFAHYAAHHNRGRPFFILAHSQGANHALRLLSEAVQGTPLERRLVAAYVPGNPTPRAVFADDLTRIPPCARPDQTGCAAVWGVFGEGHTDFAGWEAANVYWDARRRRWRAPGGQPLSNVNPVTWAADRKSAPAGLHRGAVPFGVAASHFARPLERLLGTRDDGRYVFVAPVPLPPDLFDDGGAFGGTNYHVFDISLFWLDIRENARRRLTAFLLREDRAAWPLIGGPASATARVGVPFRHRVTAANLPARFRAEGLPEGLSLDAASGEIAGVPRAAGVFPVRITAANAAGTDTAELAVTVRQAGGE